MLFDESRFLRRPAVLLQFFLLFCVICNGHRTDAWNPACHLRGRVHGSTTYAIKVKFIKESLPSLFVLLPSDRRSLFSNDVRQKSKARLQQVQKQE